MVTSSTVYEEYYEYTISEMNHGSSVCFCFILGMILTCKPPCVYLSVHADLILFMLKLSFCQTKLVDIQLQIVLFYYPSTSHYSLKKCLHVFYSCVKSNMGSRLSIYLHDKVSSMKKSSNLN